MDTHPTDAEANDSQSGFDRAVEAYRRALEPFVAGDPQPVTAFFSRREDVTLANPLGPVRRGPAAVDQGHRRGGSTAQGRRHPGFRGAVPVQHF